MMLSSKILSRTKPLTFPCRKSISTFTFLSQEPQLATPPPPPPPDPTPLPPNPASGSPLYSENWRINPLFHAPNSAALRPLGFDSSLQSMAQSLDVKSLLDLFADWTTAQRWADMKQVFEFWIRSLDKNGKPNQPNVDSYNHYLRANFMTGASPADLLDLVVGMEDYGLSPNTASFNFVLKAMHNSRELDAAQKLLHRMEQTGNESQPDDESYRLVIEMLLFKQRIDSALTIIEKALKSGRVLSTRVFNDCVSACIRRDKLDVLVSVIEKCKTMDQNKALLPYWPLCNDVAEVALQNDHSKLAFLALEFIARWIAKGQNTKPPIFISVDEGLVVSALGTAGRTYNSTLLDASWSVLKRSLRQKKVPNPETYLGKIHAYASLGNLQKAFTTLIEFESAYESFDKEAKEEMFSPFTSLSPLVVACSKNGFETLDSVYFQLENLSRAERPYKSVAALNCIILGCANIWDLDRAYQTFEALSSSFGLTPDINSYNALMYAFGRLKKTFEASRVFEHLTGLGIKPNAMSYSLLVDAHLINRDAKAALSVIDEMVVAGFTPSKETLRKVKRRCTREMDYESDDRVDSLAKKFSYRLASENRRDMLFNLDYSTDYA
ncbi:hypothetical protein Tsubulata_011537 [Turnera subulata]|uniref:Pentatricopeptide repeat-containing protein-mitochondrial domain-containing protein n=1 Tax=Turnera subulata TaxID=218843 RepID=A0A9Q0GII3_9ROSI|nr:hypothetical protein Tsubulata_011537 [Turnera subulata]